MNREYGKSKYFDYASFANIGGRADLSKEELSRLVESCGYQPGLNEEGIVRLALTHSENMYRAASLMAYGNGLAAFEDIERFALHRRIKSDIRSEDGAEDAIEIEVMLPYRQECFNISTGKLQVPHAYDSPLSSCAFQMPSVTVEAVDGNQAILVKAIVLPWLGLLDGAEYELRRIMREKAVTDEYMRKVSVLIARLDDDAYRRLGELREPYRLLGQLIANAHAVNAYIGVFGGKPEFVSKSYIDQLWQAMVELKDNQIPGICPICGKVIDRRRDAKGGHPKSTCCNAHSDKLSNERRRIRDESVEDANQVPITDSALLEQAVRKERWTRPGRNERPLKFKTFE